MTIRRVVAPDGRVWRVRRRWLPHRGGLGVAQRFARRRQRRRAEALADGADVASHIPLEEIGLALLIVVLTVLFIFVGWPLLLLLLDALWLVVVLVIGVVARVLFRRPWRVEAVDDRGHRYGWQVVGYREAGEQRDRVVELLAAGVDPQATNYAPPET